MFGPARISPPWPNDRNFGKCSDIVLSGGGFRGNSGLDGTVSQHTVTVLAHPSRWALARCLSGNALAPVQTGIELALFFGEPFDHHLASTCGHFKNK